MLAEPIRLPFWNCGDFGSPGEVNLKPGNKETKNTESAGCETHRNVLCLFPRGPKIGMLVLQVLCDSNQDAQEPVSPLKMVATASTATLNNSNSCFKFYISLTGRVFFKSMLGYLRCFTQFYIWSLLLGTILALQTDFVD